MTPQKQAPHAVPAENWFEETLLWKLKVWLQFTGWLLYLANFIAVALILSLAGLGAWVGVWPVLLVGVPLGLAGLLALNLCVDIVTVRLNIRPKEPLPKPWTDADGDIFDLMRARVSCRSFQSRLLTDAHRAELMAIANRNSAPDELLGSRPVRFEYIAAPLTVWPVVGGREFLVAIAPAEYSRMAVIDIGRSLQKTVIHATRMGLATCWIGPGADQRSIVKHLGERFDAKRDHLICVCAVGYRSRFMPMALRGIRKVQRSRLPLSDLFFADPTYTTPLATTEEPFAAFGRSYEVCQWSPSSYNAQPTRVAAVTTGTEGALTVERFDFGASTASRYYAAVALGIWCANWEMGCESLGMRGHFNILSAEDRHTDGAPELPGYDISWVVG